MSTVVLSLSDIQALKNKISFLSCRSYSLDEASLDITEYCRQHPLMDAESVGRELKRRVFDATQCTCSVGIAANRQLAKICSNLNKPDGLFLLPSQRNVMIEFMRTLPLRKVSGIGPIAEATLAGIGIETSEDVWEQRFLLARILKRHHLLFYLDVALGFPSSSFEELVERERKSIGHERTFGAQGVSTFEEAETIARELSVKLGNEVQTKGVTGKTVTLILKGIDFQRHSRSKTVDRAVCDFDSLWPHIRSLLADFFAEIGPFRLLGVRLSSLSS